MFIMLKQSKKSSKKVAKRLGTEHYFPYL
jgi:hypothetical protein